MAGPSFASEAGVDKIKAGGSVSNRFADDLDQDAEDSGSFAFDRRNRRNRRNRRRLQGEKKKSDGKTFNLGKYIDF